MGRVKCLSLLILFSCMFTFGCTKRYYASVINETDEVITVVRDFKFDSSDSQRFTFDIQPNGQETWMYDQANFMNDVVDERLKTVELISRQCKVVFDRDEIEKLFYQQTLIITDEIMNCD